MHADVRAGDPRGAARSTAASVHVGAAHIVQRIAVRRVLSHAVAEALHLRGRGGDVRDPRAVPENAEDGRGGGHGGRAVRGRLGATDRGLWNGIMKVSNAAARSVHVHRHWQSHR